MVKYGVEWTRWRRKKKCRGTRDLITISYCYSYVKARNNSVICDQIEGLKVTLSRVMLGMREAEVEVSKAEEMVEAIYSDGPLRDA